MAFATPETWIPFDKIAVQDITALMVPEAPDIGVAIVNANEVNVNSVVFEAVLKKDLTAHNSMSMEFSQVDVVSFPIEAGIYFSTSTQLMKWKSLVVADHAPTAGIKVATIKQPTIMMAAGIGHSPQSANIENTGLSGIGQMEIAAVLPNQTSKNGQDTAFLDVVMGSNATFATSLMMETGGTFAAIKNDVNRMEKESISSSCGTAYGAIIST